MRRLLTIITLSTLIATPAYADEVVLEEGAIFHQDGTCVEQDGAPGFGMPDGQCRTVADYDEMFGFANLSQIESRSPAFEGKSVAEVYNLKPDVLASERLLGEGLVEQPRSFSELLFEFRIRNGGYI